MRDERFDDFRGAGRSPASKEGLRRLPHRENDLCFACGPDHPWGLRMEFFTDEERIYSWPVISRHLSGWGSIVHGGIVTTLLDETMGWTGFHLLKKMMLTKTITVEFVKPVQVEEELRIEGAISKVRSEREAEVLGALYNAGGELCARASGVIATFTVEGMKRRGLIDRSTLEGARRIIE